MNPIYCSGHNALVRLGPDGRCPRCTPADRVAGLVDLGLRRDLALSAVAHADAHRDGTDPRDDLRSVARAIALGLVLGCGGALALLLPSLREQIAALNPDREVPK